MTVFGGLANEVLLQIIKLTSAGDIASLASCCKHLNFLAQERLAFHRQKRAEAEDIVVGWDMWETSAIHPSKHLQDILEDDDCRFYTRVMKVGSLEYGDPVDDERGDVGISHQRNKDALIDNIESQYGPEITTLVTKVYTALLPYKAYAAKTDLSKWIKAVKDGEPAAVVILLLALHPNLEILDIHEPGQDWWKESDFAEDQCGHRGNIFHSLTTAAISPATNTLKVFSRLSDFRLSGEIQGGLEASAKMVSPFMALPTMHKVLGRVVDGRGVLWPYGTGTSKVTVLDLAGDIDRASLSNLFRGLKALEHFRYQFSPPADWTKRARGRHYLNRLKWGPRTKNDAANNDPEDDESDESEDEDIGDKPRWEPRALTATLLQYAGHSLVALDLTAGGFRGVAKFSNDEPFIGTLRSFRVLKDVCIDTTMLFKRVKCSSSVSSIPGKSTQQTSWFEFRAQWLVDFLPVSIETFKMTSKFVGKGLSKSDVAAMFTGLPQLRRRLPKLSKICVEQNEDWEDKEEEEGLEELYLRCEANAISLLFEDDEGSMISEPA